MTRLLLGGILGGIVLYLFGMVSWMLVPWHETTLGTFENENLVAAVIRDNAPHRGVYVYPGEPDLEGLTDEEVDAATDAVWEKLRQGPFLFVAYDDRGTASMAGPMITAFVNQVIAAVLMTLLLMQTRGLSYWGRVGFVVVVAITGAVLCHIPNWNWWSFPTAYTLTMFGDLALGGFFAGLVIAKVVGGSAAPVVASPG